MPSRAGFDARGWRVAAAHLPQIRAVDTRVVNPDEHLACARYRIVSIDDTNDAVVNLAGPHVTKT